MLMSRRSCAANPTSGDMQLLFSRRQISKGLICSAALAPSHLGNAASSCAKTEDVQGLTVGADSKSITVSVVKSVAGLWGEAYKTGLRFTSDNSATDLSVGLAVDPGKRTHIEEVLAFWSMPKRQGRLPPVNVSITSASAAVPTELSGNLVQGREAYEWTVFDGIQPKFRAKLPGKLAPFLLTTENAVLTVEVAGMTPVSLSIAGNHLKAAVERAEVLRTDLRSKGIDPAACDEDYGGCFLTTACCGALGRPDNCFELETLRAFRQRHLQTSPAGRVLLDEYDRISPHIVRAMGGEKASGIHLAVYLACIIPCVAMIKLGLVRAPIGLYRYAVAALHRRYTVRYASHVA